MRAGELREIISIERDEGVADSYGQVVPAWRPFITNLPAEVIFTGGNEQSIADQQAAINNFKVTIRYVEGITPKMRVKWCDRVLNILSLGDPKGRRVELVLVCTEKV
jgi:SPP1 family predicted phage head-tail adaptor